MSIRYLGGIITNNATQPTLTVAKGIWTLSQQSQAKYANTWPLGIPLDPQFNYVTALLNGDGVNGAQNNTFLDSSTNNFTITRNGNTTQGSFSPYGSNWSNYLNGSTDYLDTSITSITLSSAWTIECWFYCTSLPSPQVIFDCRPTSTNGYYPQVSIASSTQMNFNYNGIDNSITVSNVLNSWKHLAVVKNSGTIKVYLDGVSVFSLADSNTTLVGASRPRIGANGYVAANYFTGYISNYRIVNGTAVYTANFTPPTSALTAISGTQLLTCQSNRFIDTSSNAFALTVNGSPSVQRFNPFGTASPYSTSVIGGSSYLDGNGDYLSLTGQNLSSVNFTIECWVNFSSFNTTSGHIFSFGADIANRYGLYRDPSTGKLAMATVNSAVYTITSATTILKTGTWYHVAWVKNGSTSTLYVNGVNEVTNTGNINSGTNWAIGFMQFATATNDYVTGYISNFRILNGTALYTANFTPPTSPLTAITNTSLLLNTTNAGIYDSAMMNDYETIDNTQLSTAVKKFGTASIYFDGTTDTLSSPSQPIYNFGTGNFTIEMWVNRAGAGTGDRFLISRSNGADFLLRYNASNVLQFYISGTLIFSYTWTFPTGTWYHIAVVRNGTSVTLYVDGTSVATGTNSSNMSSTAPLYIGGYPPTTSDYFNGYIDDLRITNGYARYTTSFTPPTAAFPTAGP